MKKRGRKPKKARRQQVRISEEQLRPMIREAARAGLVEAIEHCSNFWQVSDGFKKYIEHEVAAQSEALFEAVKFALREEFDRKRKPRRKHK